MNRTLATAALLIAGMLGITGCASESPSPSSVEESTVATQSEESDETAAETADDAGSSDTTMPQGARPGSADFPFPVPADWPELEPFTEDKIGKAVAMYAMYEFPGSAEAAAAAYEELLAEAGFTLHPNPLGEQVNDASFGVEGKINGVAYAGPVDFSTDASGTQRVVINLTEE